MAKYIVGQKENGAYAKTLTPDQVDEVEFINPPRKIRITSNGDGRINYTIDGTVPIVGGGKTLELPDIYSTDLVSIPSSIPRGEDPVVIKLISPDSPTYSISRD